MQFTETVKETSNNSLKRAVFWVYPLNSALPSTNPPPPPPPQIKPPKLHSTVTLEDLQPPYAAHRQPCHLWKEF